MNTGKRKRDVFDEIKRLRALIEDARAHDEQSPAMSGCSVSSRLIDTFRSILSEQEQVTALEARLEFALHNDAIDPYAVVAAYHNLAATICEPSLSSDEGETKSSHLGADHDSGEWGLSLLQQPSTNFPFLNIRCRNALYDTGAETLGKAAQLTEEQLGALNGFGEITVSRFKLALNDLGLSLGTTFPDDVLATIGSPKP